MFSQFVWTDLSTYQPGRSKSFYKAVFNWEYQEIEGYTLAYIANQAVCGIYETPPFFKKIGMPHFWMNYIAVQNLEETVNRAKGLKAIIEIENDSFYDGSIALIRDPLGAGFTLYEGNQLKSSQSLGHGHIKGRELHVSEVNRVSNFYSSLFDWDIDVVDKKSIQVRKDNKHIVDIAEVDKAVKGKYEYWVTIFYVDDVKSSSKTIETLGGTLVSDEGYRRMYSDPMGEAFFYISS